MKKYQKIITIAFLFVLLMFLTSLKPNKKEVVKRYRNTYTPQYVSLNGLVDPQNIQSPIKMEDRVRNYTGIQCVYSSIEALGRHAKEPKLINPPITSRSNCKSYSDPYRAGNILTNLNVKFKQEYGNKNKALEFMKSSLLEKRGTLFSIKGHAMVAVHYSESENRFCWIDNSDRSLKVQETTIDGFKRMWTGWILVIYADNDIFAKKEKKKNDLPIIDRLNPNARVPKDYVPFPEL